MIDHTMRARLRLEYDKDGETASKGTVIKPLLEELMSRDFFDRKVRFLIPVSPDFLVFSPPLPPSVHDIELTIVQPPRSAWRLDFGSSYADDILKRYASSSVENLVATFTEFTAVSVARALTDFVLPRVPNLDLLIASGGGTRNRFLMKVLSQRLTKVGGGVNLRVSDDFGIPATYKEAIKFAVLAFAAKRGLANNIPAASGASRFAVMGKLTWAPMVAKGL